MKSLTLLKLLISFLTLSIKYKNSLVWIDGANAGMVNELKIKFNEEYTTEPIDPDPEQMKILPVNFGTEHKQYVI